MIEIDTAPGAAAGIARFSAEVLDAPSSCGEDGQVACAEVPAGLNEHLVFRETDRPLPPYDGHHVRSMRHPMYARPLVNRDPAIGNTACAAGHGAAPWQPPPDCSGALTEQALPGLPADGAARPRELRHRRACDVRPRSPRLAE